MIHPETLACPGIWHHNDGVDARPGAVAHQPLAGAVR